MHQPHATTWWNRNWKWFVPVGCLTLLTLFVGVVFLLVAGVFGLMKQSDPYRHGLQAAQTHPAVIAALGSPIEPGFFASGNIHVDNASGEAKLAIPISGPKGEGTLYVEAEKQRGRWNYSALEADVGPGQPRIDLLPNAPPTP
jgi:hypothetical protein